MNIDTFSLEKKLFLSTYNRIPVEIDHGDGVYLFDKKGVRYLDLFAGLAVNALGHAHPGIVNAVSEQIRKYAHISNSYITDIQIEFAARLLKYSGMDKVFLSNSGTEAVEAAIKLIRKEKGPDKKILAFRGSFHGRTYGALTLTERRKYREGFEPFLNNVIHLPFNEINAIEQNINDSTAAVFIELIQGEGGINEAEQGFVSEIIKYCRIHNVILVVDEIQSGTGRTGVPFSYNLYGMKPDLVVTAKAIGGGLPLGALLTSDKFSRTFSAGSHGTTFGGNPVCCAAGNVVLKEVFENGLLQKVYDAGGYFLDELGKLKEEFPRHIADVRGKGFMIGVEFKYSAEDIVTKFRERNILVNVTNQNVLRLLPPLILTKDHIDQFINEFRKVLQ